MESPVLMTCHTQSFVLPVDLTNLQPLTCSNLLHNISPIQNIVYWWSHDISFARSFHYPSDGVGNCSSTTSTNGQMKAKPIFPWAMTKEKETESRSSPDSTQGAQIYYYTLCGDRGHYASKYRNPQIFVLFIVCKQVSGWNYAEL